MAIMTEMFGIHIVAQRGRIVFWANESWLANSVLEIANVIEFRYSDQDVEFHFDSIDENERIYKKIYRDGTKHMESGGLYRGCSYDASVIDELKYGLNMHCVTHENYSIPWRRLLPKEASIYFDNRGFSLYVEDESNEDITEPHVVRPIDVRFYDRDEAVLWMHQFAVNAKGR
jgi:hypothetical protein